MATPNDDEPAAVGSTTTVEHPLTTVYAIPIDPTKSTPISNSQTTQQPGSNNDTPATAIPTPKYNSYSYYQPPASSTAIPTVSPSSSTPTSTKIAVGIVVPLAFLAILGAAFFLFRRRRRKITQEQKHSRWELGFSPAPTHTTFSEKPNLDVRSASRTDTLATNGTQNRAKKYSNGMDSQMLSPTDSNMDMESDVASQADSQRSGSALGSRTLRQHSSFSSNPGPRASHIAELASADISNSFHPSTDVIHELGPGKETEEEAMTTAGLRSGSAPIASAVAELPDTSNQSIQKGKGPAPTPPTELPATKELDDVLEAEQSTSALPATGHAEHQSAATELPAPIPKVEGDVEGPTAQAPVANQETTTSWLSSEPNTPTDEKFPSQTGV